MVCSSVATYVNISASLSSAVLAIPASPSWEINVGIVEGLAA